jgi:hypothetical protein
MLSIQVNASYTRSVNIERDFNSAEIAASYIPTSTAISALQRISATFNSEACPRSWALIGPYGAGKSSFALFLAQLLSEGNEKASRNAASTLKRADPALARRFSGKLRGDLGWCRVLLTGSPEPLIPRLLRALQEGASAFWNSRLGRPPKVVAELTEAIRSADIPVSKVLELINTLQAAVERSGGGGVLVVFDELGKSLEYAARHNASEHIYLLQALAEHAAKPNKSPLQLVVLLHQAFEEYARGLGETLRNEWKKVQGRFEVMPYIESAEQTMRLLSATLRHEATKEEERGLTAYVGNVTQILKSEGALPRSLEANLARTLFVASFPLHPVSALLLPSLCQKVAQNERTLFSFIGSSEPFALHDVWQRRKNTELPWVLPHEVYDYFIRNQPGAIFDSVTHRRWAEVASALDRLGDAPALEVELLKTIGLFNIVGAQGGLRAKPEILSVCLCADAADSANGSILAALQELERKSLVVFRKFNGEYRVWQGSDFDLEQALRTEIQKIGYLDVAQVLNKQQPLGRVVARRYSMETGTFRYFEPSFVSSASDVDRFQSVSSPTCLICLPEDAQVQQQFDERLHHVRDALVVAVVLTSSTRLSEVMKEAVALERIFATNPSLGGDPIAQRETKDRLQALRIEERLLLDGIFGSPEESKWWHKGKPIEIASAQALQRFISAVLVDQFSGTPQIRNELINRDKPSSTAIAARTRLLLAMLDHADKRDLGIEKFPPELAIYRAVLQATGLHSFESGRYGFTEPKSRKDLLPLWQAIDSFFNETTAEPISVEVLFDRLQERPIGLKKGLLPLFFVSAYQATQQELALFEGGRFVPTMTREIVETIIREPKIIAVQRVRLAGINQSLLEKYSGLVSQTSNQPAPKNLLAVVKPFAKFFAGLPPYTQRTRSVSPEAQALRGAYAAARSPSELLFKSIPAALGFKDLEQQDEGASQAFAEKLRLALRELGSAYATLLRLMRERVAHALHADSDLTLPRLRANIAERYDGLQKFTIDTEGLKAFIGRLTDRGGSDDLWLEGVLSFLGKKPSDKWTDEDLPIVEYRLSDLARRIADLERLRLAFNDQGTQPAEGFEAVLLRIVSRDRGEQEKVLYLSSAREAALREALATLRTLLGNIEEPDLRLLALMKLASEELSVPKTTSDEVAHRAHNKKP